MARRFGSQEETSVTSDNFCETDVPKRVLAIDGGGLKGAMPAAFLAEIERVTEERILDHFDLVVGTSTGGIIALGIGLGLTCKEIVAFYRERGPLVFGGGRRSWLGAKLWSAARGVRWWVTSKHDSKALRSALDDVFGDRRLGESSTRLVVPAWDSVQGRPCLFKTAHHPDFGVDYSKRAVDVAMATAAAPTFFPAHRWRGIDFLDGGTFANNPATVAAVEAVATLRWGARNVAMLSLGCTSERIVAQRKLGLRNVKAVIELILQAQGEAALATAKVLLGGGAPSLRIDLPVEPGFAGMDDPRHIDKLAGLGEGLARRWLKPIQEGFLAARRQPFVPCRTLPTRAARAYTA